MIKFSTLGVKSTPKVLLVNYKLVKLYLFSLESYFITTQLRDEFDEINAKRVEVIAPKVASLITSSRLKGVINNY